jgi:protocatechuate 3,4-dioxygenase alpha subunit
MSLSPTPSQTVGPFFAIGLCRRAENEPGTTLRLHGRLIDGAGEPIVDGVVEVWDASRRKWGRSGTDAQGSFTFTIDPPDPCLHVLVFARGLLKHQLTRVYAPGASDAVLASLPEEQRETLVAADEDGALRFDIRMQGPRQTVFFAV